MHSELVCPMDFNLSSQEGVIAIIKVIVLKTSNSDEVSSRKLSTHIIGTSKMQQCLEVRHAFTHGHLKAAPRAFVRRSQAMTSLSSESDDHLML